MNSGTPLVACTGGLKLGGSTTFLLNLGKSVREKGLCLPVVSMEDENPMAADFAAAGVSVHIVPRRGTIYEDRIRLSYLATAPFRPEAVISCLGAESFELLRLVPRGTVRLGIIQSDDPGPFQMARNYAPWLDAMVGVSQSICANLKNDPVFAKVQVEHIPYGISFGTPVARTPWDTSKPIKLIYIGRIIEEQKRISRLVELSRQLVSRGVNFEVTFVGNGPDMSKTQEALEGVKEARFLGEVANAEVPALLRSHDIFVLLSDYEGLPLSLLEAMGQGVVPVISDLQSGIREAVTDRVGIRVPVGDVPAAADAIISLVRSPQRLAELSASASESARQQYSAMRMAERYLDLIGRLAKAQAAWPADVRVEPPMIVKHQWLYRGLARKARRFLQRLRKS
jgi:glycosyltransferase involved in cell wall biosynthesis